MIGLSAQGNLYFVEQSQINHVMHGAGYHIFEVVQKLNPIKHTSSENYITANVECLH